MMIPLNRTGREGFLNIFLKPKKEKKSENLYLNQLKKQLKDSKENLECAIDNFNNVTDPKLVDIYIYKIRAEEARFEHILGEIKELDP